MIAIALLARPIEIGNMTRVLYELAGRDDPVRDWCKRLGERLDGLADSVPHFDS